MFIQWKISRTLLDKFLEVWWTKNNPVPFLRRAGQNHRQGTKAREPWHLTEAGRTDLEAYRERINHENI